MHEFDPNDTQEAELATQEADLVTNDGIKTVVLDKDATQEASAVADNLTRSIEWYCNEHPTAITDFFVEIVKNPSTTRDNKELIAKFFLDNNLTFGDVANNSKKLQELVTEYYLTHSIQPNTAASVIIDIPTLRQEHILLDESQFYVIMHEFYTKEILNTMN